MRWPPSLALAMLAGVVPLAAQDPPEPVTLRGRVLDAQTGEPIAKALVSIRGRKAEAVTDAGGRFALVGVPPGEAEITVTTVGYGRARKMVHAGPEAEELEIRLSQEALRRAEEVAVSAAPFEALDPAAPAAHVLEGTELENLASVLVDDPLRSVQSLPGVAASDDFGATFAARGLGFSNVGFYVDGVLMNAPFHTIRDVNDSFSLTLLNGDVVESLSLLTGGAPARYGDRTGSVLALKTRDGSHEEFVGRASLGATGLYVTLEGPMGEAKKTSWLVSARKSYLDYVLERLDESGVVLGFYDTTVKLTHTPRPTQKISLGFLHGRSRWESTETDPSPRIHTLRTPAPTWPRCSGDGFPPPARGWRASHSSRARPAATAIRTASTASAQLTRSGGCARRSHASSGITAWKPASCYAALPRTPSHAGSRAGPRPIGSRRATTSRALRRACTCRTVGRDSATG